MLNLLRIPDLVSLKLCGFTFTKDQSWHLKEYFYLEAHSIYSTYDT